MPGGCKQSLRAPITGPDSPVILVKVDGTFLVNSSHVEAAGVGERLNEVTEGWISKKGGAESPTVLIRFEDSSRNSWSQLVNPLQECARLRLGHVVLEGVSFDLPQIPHPHEEYEFPFLPLEIAKAEDLGKLRPHLAELRGKKVRLKCDNNVHMVVLLPLLEMFSREQCGFVFSAASSEGDSITVANYTLTLTRFKGIEPYGPGFADSRPDSD